MHDASEMRAALSRLYISLLRTPKNFETLKSEELSCPLLMTVCEQWTRSRHRVLVVGQETARGWGEGSGIAGCSAPTLAHVLQARNELPTFVERLMKSYDSYLHGDGGYTSPFWRAYKEIMSKADQCALWTNCIWFDLKGGSARKSNENQWREILAFQKNRLTNEIKILKPTAVVFFSGPNYDSALEAEFGHGCLQEVGGLQRRAFARVLLPDVLPERSFRTYHPRYLRLAKKDCLLNELHSRLRD